MTLLNMILHSTDWDKRDKSKIKEYKDLFLL